MNTITLLKAKWHQEVNEYLDSLGIFACERCGARPRKLDLSHGKKQRFLKTRELYFFAARLCRACHVWAEYGKEPGKPYEKPTHERLERIHRELIAKRNAYVSV